MEDTRPAHGSQAFTCPHCDAYTQQIWARGVLIQNGASSQPWRDIDRATCYVCRKNSVWLSTIEHASGGESFSKWQMIWPTAAGGLMAHPRLPSRLEGLYREARDVAPVSPRSAAALLRLLTEDLLQEVTGSRNKLNENIGQLVRDGMIGQQEQRMADFLRITGNGAVHPGQLEVPDDQLAARTDLMFRFVNLLVEKFIALPALTEEAYAQLPQGSREAIDRRDAVAQ